MVARSHGDLKQLEEMYFEDLQEGRNVWHPRYPHKRLTIGRFQTLCFSADGHFASMGYDGSIVLFDKEGQTLRRLEEVHVGRQGRTFLSRWPPCIWGN